MKYVIRRVEPGDYEALHRIFSGPRVVWGTMQLPYPSLEMWRKRLEEPPEGLIKLVACLEDGEVVGQLGLHTSPNHPRRRHAGGIGMAVRDDWQGKGVGTALLEAAIELADRWLDLTRLDLQVFADNEPAIRLYEKFGFRIEGTLARYAFRDGEYVDTHIMARLREEGEQG
jgi:putative acetyltransferase